MKLAFLYTLIIGLVCTDLVFSQMTVKDNDSNILLKVNDEGKAGSVEIPDTTNAPSSTTNKLYNIGGSLYWSGNALGLSGSSGGWTDDGSAVRLTTSTDRVGIGLASPNSLANMQIYRTSQGVPLFIDNHRGGSSFSPASSITYGLLTSVASDDADSKFGIVTNALGDGGTKYAIWADANGTGTNWCGYFNDGNVYIANQVGLGTTSLNSLVQLDITRTSQGCPLFINNHRGGSSFPPASSITYGLLTSVASDDADSKFGIVTNALGDGGTKYAIWADANGTGTNWCGYFNDGNVYIANDLTIGTTSPSSETQVHVQTDTDDNFGVLVESKGTAGSEIGLHTDDGLYCSLVKNAYFNGSWNRFTTSYGSFVLEVTPSGETDFKVAASGSNPISWTTAITIETNGEVGIGTVNPAGKLDVNGSIYQRGSSLHADYVFEPDYQLESIEEHAAYMWKNKHLKAIPKAQKDAEGREIVEVGSHRKGIVEELEKAHIYIEQLHQEIQLLKKQVSELVKDK